MDAVGSSHPPDLVKDKHGIIQEYKDLSEKMEKKALCIYLTNYEDLVVFSHFLTQQPVWVLLT